MGEGQVVYRSPRVRLRQADYWVLAVRLAWFALNVCPVYSVLCRVSAIARYAFFCSGVVCLLRTLALGSLACNAAIKAAFTARPFR